MNITPQELRDLDIAESFRGYNRDEVNELLERAAKAIEDKIHEISVLEERVGSAVADVGRSRDSDDILQRTLIMAQRAADDAVAAANAEAETIRHAAMTEAQTMLERARVEVQRFNDEERGRIEREVIDLATRRDALVQDVAALEAWDTDYRARLVRQIESDLTMARNRPMVEAGPAPELAQVSVSDLGASEQTQEHAAVMEAQGTSIAAPSMDDMMETAVPVAESVESTPTMAMTFDDERTPAPLIGSAQPAIADVVEALLERPEPDATPAAAAPSSSDRSSYLDEVLAAPSPRRAAPDIDLRAAEADRANLDDEAFFATLREAVADDAPLGPSSQVHEDDRDPGFREMFKRRR